MAAKKTSKKSPKEAKKVTKKVVKKTAKPANKTAKKPVKKVEKKAPAKKISTKKPLLISKPTAIVAPKKPEISKKAAELFKGYYKEGERIFLRKPRKFT